MAKIIIAGTRTFQDFGRLVSVCDQLLEGPLEVVSGGARGADQLGERYAALRGYGLTCFPANWQQYGKEAGPIRNRQMVAYADRAIVFWDGRSSGTKDLIRACRQAGKSVRVVVL